MKATFKRMNGRRSDSEIKMLEFIPRTGPVIAISMLKT